MTNETYGDQIRRVFAKAKRDKNVEAMAYYEQAFSYCAVVAFESFKGSWAYGEWIKRSDTIARINLIKADMKRFNYL